MFETKAILGPAGSGKSTELRNRMEGDARYVLTSTTGISAVNLGEGVTTVHSALGLYDLRSAYVAYESGKLARKAMMFAEKGIKAVVIDEISTLQGEMLDCIHDGFTQAARMLPNHIEPTGLTLVGDWCQLPPVADRRADGKPGVAQYGFESRCWPSYAQPDNLTRLTKIHRQEDAAFLQVLQMVRKGNGVDAAIDLKKAGVEFVEEEDDSFDGITLFAINAQVDGYNERRLAALPGDYVNIPSRRWGVERSEWKNIPLNLSLKDGALVMILANDRDKCDGKPEMKFVNGDLGTFRVGNDSECSDWLSSVETKRGYNGPIPLVLRRNYAYEHVTMDEAIAEYTASSYGRRLESELLSDRVWSAVHVEYMDSQTMQGRSYYDPREKALVIGEVEYMPLRVAYGSTVHKVQGLTMDKVQINIGHYWFGNPSMVYVALSRVRSIAGLRIVGDVGRLARRIKTDRRVLPWV